MGVAGFCADDFPWEPFKEAMAVQVGSPVTITGVVDDSDACSRRRLGGASFGQQRRQLPVAIKQAKVSFEVDFDADEQSEADLATSTLSSLNATAFEAVLETRIIFYYGSVPSDFGVPPGAIEAPQTVHMSPAPTPAPTVPPTPESGADGKVAGMEQWQFALVVVGAILLMAFAYISTQSQPERKIEKVFAGDDEDEDKEVSEANQAPSNPTISGVNPGYNPTVSAPDSNTQVPEITAPPLAPSSPSRVPVPAARLTISPTAKKGPPLDLLVDSLYNSDDEEE
jgi:hypothetical protein